MKPSQLVGKRVSGGVPVTDTPNAEAATELFAEGLTVREVATTFVSGRVRLVGYAYVRWMQDCLGQRKRREWSRFSFASKLGHCALITPNGSRGYGPGGCCPRPNVQGRLTLGHPTRTISWFRGRGIIFPSPKATATPEPPRLGAFALSARSISY